jgi:hypothetical protein
MKNISFVVISTAMLALFPMEAHAVATISGTYYDENTATSCNNNDACLLKFSTTPTTQYLTVNEVSCYINIPSSNNFNGLVLGVDGVSTRAIYLPTASHAISNFNHLDFVQFVDFKIGSSKIPTISLSTSLNGTLFMACTIKGTLSTQ